MLTHFLFVCQDRVWLRWRCPMFPRLYRIGRGVTSVVLWHSRRATQHAGFMHNTVRWVREFSVFCTLCHVHWLRAIERFTSSPMLLFWFTPLSVSVTSCRWAPSTSHLSPLSNQTCLSLYHHHASPHDPHIMIAAAYILWYALSPHLSHFSDATRCLGALLHADGFVLSFPNFQPRHSLRENRPVYCLLYTLVLIPADDTAGTSPQYGVLGLRLDWSGDLADLEEQVPNIVQA